MHTHHLEISTDVAIIQTFNCIIVIEENAIKRGGTWLSTQLRVQNDLFGSAAWNWHPLYIFAYCSSNPIRSNHSGRKLPERKWLVQGSRVLSWNVEKVRFLKHILIYTALHWWVKDGCKLRNYNTIAILVDNLGKIKLLPRWSLEVGESQVRVVHLQLFIYMGSQLGPIFTWVFNFCGFGVSFICAWTTVDQTIAPVNWGAIALIMTSH